MTSVAAATTNSTALNKGQLGIILHTLCQKINLNTLFCPDESKRIQIIFHVIQAPYQMYSHTASMLFTEIPHPSIPTHQRAT